MADISFTGNLGGDAETRFTASGKQVLNFSVAESHRRKNGTEWEDDGTTWWRVTAWDHLAERLAEHLLKGTRVFVSGTVRSREFEHNGQQRTAYDVTARQVGIVPKAAQASAGGSSAAPGDVWGAGQSSTAEPPF